MSGSADYKLATVCGTDLIEFCLYYANEMIGIVCGWIFGSCRAHNE